MMQRLLLSTSTLLVLAASASAAPLYFRPEAGGGYPVTSGTYTWNTSAADWYTEPSPGGSAQAWNNNASDTALLWAGTYVVQLSQNISVGGIDVYYTNPPNNSGTVSFRSADTTPANWVTLTLSGATIQASSGGSRGFAFSDLNVAGNFTVKAGPGNQGAISFANTTFTGQMTAQGRNVSLGAGLTNADVVLDNGSILLGASATAVSRISGNGTIGPSANNRGLLLQQDTNSVLVGGFVNPNGRSGFSFTKAGAGTFILQTADAQTTGGVTINEGAFYSGGTFNAVPATPITVGNATLGGTFTSEKTIVLNSAASTLNPGMATLDEFENVENHAGTMTLANGISGASGGTFNFFLDENVDGLVNSQINITGGTVTLGGTKTVNLFGLGAGLLQTGVTYVLFDADGAAVRTAGWDMGWSLNDNTTGLDVDFFGFVGNELQVMFIPEPTTSLLMLFGLLSLVAIRRTSRLLKS